MPIPTCDSSPSRYDPNATDDRATGSGPIYLALATAIEAIEGIYDDALVYKALDAQTRKNIRTADNALRRAAFSLVIHHR